MIPGPEQINLVLGFLTPKTERDGWVEAVLLG